MTGTIDDSTGDERCFDMVAVVSGGLQKYSNTGKKCANKWLLMNEIYFQCGVEDAATDAGMSTVQTESTS